MPQQVHQKGVAGNTMSSQRPFQFSLATLLVVLTAICVLMADPARFISVVVVTFGVACTYEALRDRDSGWVFGAVFGSFFVVSGLALLLGFLSAK